MFSAIREAVSALRSGLDELAQQSLSGSEAAELLRILTEGERICAAGRTLAARHIETSNVWQHDGHRSAAEWIAAETGTMVGQAIGVLETAHRLEELPLTKAAFASGRLSELQTREISAAAVADPRKERHLLEAARTHTALELRNECRRVRAAAVPDETEAYLAIHRRRYVRHWTDPDGAVRLDARLTPDAGAAVIATIDERTASLLTAERRAGRRESSDAYAADALVELVTGTERQHPRAMVHVVVDHAALTSGHATADQRCEIPGIGRIPVATARALSKDSIIKAIVTKGSDIWGVTHVGRSIPPRLRTALEARDPVCVVPGCDRRKGLEIDHYKVAYADGGPTSLGNLARLCRWHHYAKTHLGFRLSGVPGAWVWETPSDLEGVNAPDARPPPES
jgi:hypothetical protein